MTNAKLSSKWEHWEIDLFLGGLAFLIIIGNLLGFLGDPLWLVVAASLSLGAIISQFWIWQELRKKDETHDG